MYQRGVILFFAITCRQKQQVSFGHLFVLCQGQWHPLQNDKSWFDFFNALRPPPAHLCLSCMCTENCGVFSVENVAVGHAFDLVLLQSDQDPSLIECSDICFSFDPLFGLPASCCLGDIAHADVYLQVENCDLRFPIENKKIKYPDNSYGGLDDDEENNANLKDYEEHDPRALKKLTECCSFGQPTRARVVVESLSTWRIIAMAPFDIYFWSSSDRIFVCDIDGTVTKSNILGILDTVVTQQYTFCHDGVCEFLQSLVKKPEEKQAHTRPFEFYT
jgi:hypothetical protein